MIGHGPSGRPSTASPLRSEVKACTCTKGSRVEVYTVYHIYFFARVRYYSWVSIVNGGDRVIGLLPRLILQSNDSW